jgi:uncharacterized membrane protein
MARSSPPPTAGLRLNRALLWFSRRWLRIALVFIGLYAALPILTPVFMRVGLTGPATVLYSLYSPFCHQFVFRSLFLFGEQPAYPRAITGTSETPFEVYAAQDPVFIERYRFWYAQFNGGEDPGPVTTESLSDFTPWLQFAARDWVGNPQMGYKMTLCARDVAIYTALFAGGLVYSIPNVRRRLRPAPFLLLLFLGVGPIAIDGFSQLFGYPPFNLWPPRETLPIFRVVTGALFGLMGAWFVFPHLDQSMRETRLEIEAKLRRAGLPV